MDCLNNAAKLRREILIRVAKAAMADRLPEEAPHIPLKMRPKASENSRCCVYRDRAVLRSRVIAALGIAVEGDDEATGLAEYAGLALEREAPSDPIMTVLDIACKGCVPSRYYVTDACQGCVARPCMVNCPGDAIDFKDGRSIIHPEKCIDCGKCKQVCPYSAVIKIPVPCEEACPVGAIRKNGEGRAAIDFDRCISCGRCMRSCPFGAVMERSQIVDVIKASQGQRPMVAMVAPAILGQFPGDLEQIAQALSLLGFARTVEVAQGADITTEREAAEFAERMEAGAPLMTTSCCPAYIETVRRHIPELQPFVSETRTPMHYTAQTIKDEDPNTITVFIGPCVAKRKEGVDDPAVDYVLTFEELGTLLVAADIEVCLLEGMDLENPPSAEGRGYAIAGGVAAAVKARAATPDAVKPVSINGLDEEGLNRLREFATGTCPGNLVEVMACNGGCIGGAGVIARKAAARRAVEGLCSKSRAMAG